MEELSLWAPGIVGLVVAGTSLFYAHWISGHRRKPTGAQSVPQEPRLPFEFSSPTVLGAAEGSVQAHVNPSREHVH
jgi:hypothetical protein